MKKILLFIGSLLILMSMFGCTNSKGKVDKQESSQSYMDTFFAYQDNQLLPGILSWGETSDSLIKKLNIKTDQISSQDENQIVVDNLIQGLPDGCSSKVAFQMQENLVALNLIIFPGNDDEMSKVVEEVISWGKKHLPEAEVNNEIWQKEVQDIVDEVMKAENSGITFSWNFTDMNYMSIDLFRGDQNMIQIQATRP